MYFDRDGQPISLEKWRELHHIHGYPTVLQSDAEGQRITTAWIGLSSLFDRPKWIFETRVWDPTGCVLREYHDTYAEAIEGHLRHARVETARAA